MSQCVPSSLHLYTIQTLTLSSFCPSFLLPGGDMECVVRTAQVPVSQYTCQINAILLSESMLWGKPHLEKPLSID